MHSSIILLSAAAALLDIASAHGFVTGIKVKGTWTAGSDPVWWYHASNDRPQTAGWDALNQDIGFVEPASMGTSDVNCHKSATAGRLYANVNAGDTIEFAWNTWPDSHKGPIINYIAPCNGKQHMSIL
jgi:cellulase